MAEEEVVSYYASAGALSMHAARVLDPLSSAHCNITATVALKRLQRASLRTSLMLCSWINAPSIALCVRLNREREIGIFSLMNTPPLSPIISDRNIWRSPSARFHF